MATKHPDVNRSQLYEQIGAEIIRRRKAAGLTTHNLADKLDTDRGFMFRIEIGAVAVPVHLLVKIAKFFNCTVNDLIPGCVAPECVASNSSSDRNDR